MLACAGARACCVRAGLKKKNKKKMNIATDGVSHLSILYADLVGMSILFTKISKLHHENPQFLRHPIKFAIVDPYTVKLN